MRMGRILPTLHHLGSACVFVDCGFAQISFGVEWEKGGGTASVLRGEKKLPAGMYRNVSAASVGADHAGEFL